MEKRIYYWIDQLIALLKILAADPKDQIKYIEKLGTMPLLDEFALELDDMLWVLDYCPKENILNCDFIVYVREISSTFREMSQSIDKSLWYVESLYNREEWKKIRLLANKAIALSK